MMASLTSKSDIEERNFEVVFDADQRKEKLSVLNRKISSIQKRKELGIADKRDHEKFGRLLNRQAHVDSVWVFTNHIVIKSGAELKYMKKKGSGLFKKTPKQFNIDFGTEVWI